MSKKRSKDDADGTDLPKEEWCYVVTYEEWNHGLPTETAHAVVGVFKTKEAAAAAVGGYEGTGWGAMDSVTEEDREEFGSTDNRDNPPENGLLFSLFADGTGEGDFIHPISHREASSAGLRQTTSRNKPGEEEEETRRRRVLYR